MPDFDLIVIGAGPGGSNAAAVALRAGLRVAQIDAARFPRVKPCAGGVTMKASRALQLDLAPSLRRTFHAIEFNVWRRRTNRFVHPRPVIQMVSRPALDNHLVHQNRSHAGFVFVDGCPVRHIVHDGRFNIATDRGTFTAAQLVGADGAHSIVNRIFGISRPLGVATAVEVNIPGASEELQSRVAPCLDYGAIDQGYGWVFPKDDHWSAGLYTLARTTRDIRGQLWRYLRSKGLHGAGMPQTLEAARLPVGGFRLRVPHAPVYLVGDAGGFADALTGEGIYAALESGRLAGETAIDVASGRSGHGAYYRRLWKHVLCDTTATFYAARLVYRQVDRGIGVLQNPLVWRSLIEGYAAASTFCGCFLRSVVHVPRSLADDCRVEQAGWDEGVSGPALRPYVAGL
jgi:geranylgeranyl reductase family protein